MSVEESKKLLRKKFLQARKQLGDMEKLVLNGAIAARIIAMEEFVQADVVAAYASDGIEVNLRGVIETALQMHKQVAMPRYNAEKSLYDLAVIEDFQRDMVTGKYGLPEPREDLPLASLSAKTLWLIPAVAFDRNGMRLGRGGGFYDRLLENAPGYRVGVFYQCQYCSDLLPAAEHDQRLDMAVTEQTIYKFN